MSVIDIDIFLNQNELHKLDNLCCLVLTDIEKTPPHCSLLTNNHWWSLNNHENKMNVSSEILFKTLLTRRKPALFLELKNMLDTDTINTFFSNYQKINISRHITCISPIKDIFIYLNMPVSKNNFLYEMIDNLYQNNLIAKVYAFNYTSGKYCIDHYSESDLKTILL